VSTFRGLERGLLAGAALAMAVLSPAAPHAEAGIPLGPLMPKLQASSARFEAMLEKASFTVALRVESFDRAGKVREVKDGAFRLRAAGLRHRVEVLRYSENGRDLTAEARAKARESEGEKPDPDDQVHMPFLASEVSKYVFRTGETDVRDRARVRIYFRAKKPARTLFDGSAWVDSRTGEVLSMGVSPSKRALFVDRLGITLEFGVPTKEGPAVSRIDFDGEGGFWFFHERFHGSALLSEYAIP